MSNRQVGLPLKPLEGNPGIPRTLLPEGSPEWCYRTVKRLRWALEQVCVSEGEYDQVLDELKAHRAWEVIPTPEAPYGSLEVLLQKELGLGQEQAKQLKVAQQAEAKRELNPNGVKADDTCSSDIIRGQPTKFGTSADYLTARIGRDRPDILQRMKDGEFSSVRKAALEAGIVQPTITIPLDPSRAARSLRRHFKGEAWAALLREMHDMETTV